MTAVEQINAMVKQAQMWGHFAPAHSAEEARNWHKTTVPIARTAIKGAVKGGIGAIRSLQDVGKWLSRSFLRPAMADVGRLMPKMK